MAGDGAAVWRNCDIVLLSSQAITYRCGNEGMLFSRGISDSSKDDEGPKMIESIYYGPSIGIREWGEKLKQWPGIRAHMIYSSAQGDPLMSLALMFLVFSFGENNVQIGIDRLLNGGNQWPRASAMESKL